MKYAFGSNHLYVGDGLVEVLEYLEKIYEIDFNRLEEKRIEKKKKVLAEIEEKLDAGEIIRVEAGTKKVGFDIPAGKLKMVNLKEKYSPYLSVDIYNIAGDSVRHIFTRDDQVDVILEDGYYIESFDAYSLKKDM